MCRLGQACARGIKNHQNKKGVEKKFQVTCILSFNFQATKFQIYNKTQENAKKKTAYIVLTKYEASCPQLHTQGSLSRKVPSCHSFEKWKKKKTNSIPINKTAYVLTLIVLV